MSHQVMSPRRPFGCRTAFVEWEIGAGGKNQRRMAIGSRMSENRRGGSNRRPVNGVVFGCEDRRTVYGSTVYNLVLNSHFIAENSAFRGWNEGTGVFVSRALNSLGL
jgi:hypothetical protein